MIVDAIGSLLIGIISAIVGALPTAGDMDMDGFGAAVAAFKAFDAGLPVSETLAMGMMCLGLMTGIFVTRLLITLYHMIPAKFT